MFNRYSSLFITAFSPSKQASPNSKHASPHHYFPCDPSQNPRSYPHISQCFLYISIGSPEPLDDLLSETIALPKTPNLSSHTLPTLSAIPVWARFSDFWLPRCAMLFLQLAHFGSLLRIPSPGWFPPACPSGPSLHVLPQRKLPTSLRLG